MTTQGTGLWDTEVPITLCKGAEPSLSHAQEPHSFSYFVSDLQKQKYLLANYEGPESSYWVHISLTLLSEWMAASSVSWPAFKHADCWASLDSELTISERKKKKKKGSNKKIKKKKKKGRKKERKKENNPWTWNKKPSTNIFEMLLGWFSPLSLLSIQFLEMGTNKQLSLQGKQRGSLDFMQLRYNKR